MKVWVLTRSYWGTPCNDFKGVWKGHPSIEDLTKVVLSSFVASRIHESGKYSNSIEDQFWYLKEVEIL